MALFQKIVLVLEERLIKLNQLVLEKTPTTKRVLSYMKSLINGQEWLGNGGLDWELIKLRLKELV
jgi:hypothetical protein